MGKAVVLFALCVASGVGASQLLPPPHDGDIRAVYFELRDQTEIFLTIVPNASGRGTPGVTLVFVRQFGGRTPREPATSDTPIEIRAYPGKLWNPRAVLWFEIDGERVPLAGPDDALSTNGVGPDYLSVETTVDVLARIAAARHVSADALGLAFELTDAQRAAFRVFVERLEGTAKRHLRSDSNFSRFDFTQLSSCSTTLPAAAPYPLSMPFEPLSPCNSVV